MPRPIRSVEEFYAHALAIEREASERYAEFEGYFRERGEDILAGLCANLSRMESEHFTQLSRSSHLLQLPVIAEGEHRWLEGEPPEAPAHELFHRVANPHQLLEIALRAECAALAFFEWSGRTTDDASVRSLAREMAAEEAKHIRWVRNALEYQPLSPADWERFAHRAMRV
jgi:rubrerythrin